MSEKPTPKLVWSDGSMRIVLHPHGSRRDDEYCLLVESSSKDGLGMDSWRFTESESVPYAAVIDLFHEAEALRAKLSAAMEENNSLRDELRSALKRVNDLCLLASGERAKRDEDGVVLRRFLNGCRNLLFSGPGGSKPAHGSRGRRRPRAAAWRDLDGSFVSMKSGSGAVGESWGGGWGGGIGDGWGDGWGSGIGDGWGSGIGDGWGDGSGSGRGGWSDGWGSGIGDGWGDGSGRGDGDGDEVPGV